jgi:hypothetical protein
VDQEEILIEIKKIQDHQKTTKTLLGKIKKMLCLSPTAALREIEDTIDEKV